jgi:hypothetical protein
MITLEARRLGRKTPLLPDWSIPYPPDLSEGGAPLTLRALITRIVLAEVRAFRERQEQRRLLHVLSAPEIAEGVARGKVDPGSRDLHQEVEEDRAVGTALQAFEDGLYLVLVDGEEQRELDREIFLRPDSRIRFLRLVFLAGG